MQIAICDIKVLPSQSWKIDELRERRIVNYEQVLVSKEFQSMLGLVCQAFSPAEDT